MQDGYEEETLMLKQRILELDQYITSIIKEYQEKEQELQLTISSEA